MENIFRAMKHCLPICHNQPAQSDEELRSFPPAVIRQPTHKSQPLPTPVSGFRDLINKRLQSLQQRRRLLIEPEFQEDLDQQIRDAKNLDAIAGKLMDGVDRQQSVVHFFGQLSNNIQQHQLLRYESTALHNVYALASHKAGDCESICKLYAFSAWGAGHKDIKFKQLKGDFSFKLDCDGMLPGRRKDDQFNFVLHTVLQTNDSNGRAVYFDPLFGKCVDISAYGVDLNKYLKGGGGKN